MGDSFAQLSASLEGARCLVVPLLSVGNVPQLTVDLVINSLRLPRVGVVTDASVEPMCSSDVYGADGSLSFACELFALQEKVVVLQLRSKLADNEIRRFCRHLAAFCAKHGLEELVILGAWDSAWLEHPDVDGLKVKFEATTKTSSDILLDMGLQPLAWTRPAPGQPSMSETVHGQRTFADSLPRAFGADFNISSLNLFCAEGENVHEAQLLARVMLAFLQRREMMKDVSETFTPVAPTSWKTILDDANPDAMRQLFQ